MCVYASMYVCVSEYECLCVCASLCNPGFLAEIGLFILWRPDGACHIEFAKKTSVEVINQLES